MMINSVTLLQTKSFLLRKIKTYKNALILSSLVILTIIFVSLNSLNHQKNLTSLDNLLNNVYLKKTFQNIFDNLDPKFKQITHNIAKGENLNNVFKKYSVSEEEAKKIINIINKEINLNKLSSGTEINFTIDQSMQKIIEFKFPLSQSKYLVLKKHINHEKFEKKIISTKLSKKIIYEENIILDSLYRSAVTKKIPPNIIIEFARIYGFEIDFQRDIKKRDSFQIMYEAFYDENNIIQKTGNILYANLNLSGLDNELFYFKNQKVNGHFNKIGKSIIKTLMKTPINGARLSSPFGMRKHPIDGFNKMHRGTDFAAPLGTPIMASGDGTITKIGWCGGGGNCIKIKHNSTYETVYAHMSKFANNVKKGSKVKQGMIIGFVGSTGKSTGPHLHYEVIVNGKKVNSQTLKLPAGKSLKQKNRLEFETQKIKINVLKSEKIMGLS